MIKHGIIRDPGLVAFLEDCIEDAANLSLPADQINWLVAQQCRIKAGVVAADETEKGLREILNYGHTVGHALEVVTHYDYYKHGEAVCLGMLAAGYIAVEKGMWSRDAFERQNALIARLGIPKGVPDLKVDEVLARMASDKKARDGVIRFVLPERIGKIVPRDDVPRGRNRCGDSLYAESGVGIGDFYERRYWPRMRRGSPLLAQGKRQCQ